jgi:hypothetical protein
MVMNKIDISMVNNIPEYYPEEFKLFCEKHNLKFPQITSSNGKALSVMLKYKDYFWDRKSCDMFVEKFSINTRDSIQLFNKHSQWGIQTSSGIERGKYYIKHPFSLSTKHRMRKFFSYNGDDKNLEIDKIRSTIQHDYIDVPNEQWQLGHRNPNSPDNTDRNLVLQPPIQSKYRDDYYFIDTLTKFPLPKKLKSLITKKDIVLTQEQKIEYFKVFLDEINMDIELRHEILNKIEF